MFHIHQVLQPYFDRLLALAPFDDARAASIVAALDHVPVAVDRAIASLDRPANALRRAALELLDGIGDRVEESVGALTDHLPSASRGPLHTSLAPARVALERFTHHLETLGVEAGGEGTAVGEAAFVWFLRNVAVMPETPQELLRTARTEWDRAVVWEAVAMQRAATVPPAPLPASAAEQVVREAEDAAAVVAFYEEGGWLTQPPDLRRYLTAELPAYLAPLSFLGVCRRPHRRAPPRHRRRRRTCHHRTASWATSPPPTPATRGPASSTRAPTTSSWPSPTGTPTRSAAATTTRRRTRGSPSTTRSTCCTPACSTTRPHTRTVIWNFARLRALRVEVDVRLATGSMTLDEAVRVLRAPRPDGPRHGVRRDRGVRRQPRLRPHLPGGQDAAARAGGRGRRDRPRGVLAAPGARLRVARGQRAVRPAAVGAARRPLRPRRGRRRPRHGRPGPGRRLEPLSCASAPSCRARARCRPSWACREMARRLERAGFASLWVSDHVVMPTTVVSRYPYSGDGAMTWVTDDPWYDALIVLAQAAAATESVELRHRRARAAQRNPVVLAQQEYASLDRLAGDAWCWASGPAGWPRSSTR